MPACKCLTCLAGYCCLLCHHKMDFLRCFGLHIDPYPSFRPAPASTLGLCSSTPPPVYPSTRQLTNKLAQNIRHRWRPCATFLRLLVLAVGFAASAFAALWFVAMAAKLEGHWDATWKQVNLALWITLGLVGCFGICVQPVKAVVGGITMVSCLQALLARPACVGPCAQ